MVARNFRRPAHLDDHGEPVQSIALVIRLLRVRNVQIDNAPSAQSGRCCCLVLVSYSQCPRTGDFELTRLGTTPARQTPATGISTRLSLLNRLDDDAAMTYLRARMRAGIAEVMPVSGR